MQPRSHEDTKNENGFPRVFVFSWLRFDRGLPTGVGPAEAGHYVPLVTDC